MEYKRVEQVEPEDVKDPLQEQILAELERIRIASGDTVTNYGNYLFNHDEFVDSLQYIVADQLSVLRGEQVERGEWAKRFNRWFVFCDGVVNMGISCVYKQEALGKEDYETIFKGIRVNAMFETAFLKPRGIKIVFAYKNDEIKEQYKWLAMPTLEITDDQGVVHQIAITPSPGAAVWWLDILSQFHANYNWDWKDEEDLVTTVDDPYAAVTDFELDVEDSVVDTHVAHQPNPHHAAYQEEQDFLRDQQATIAKRQKYARWINWGLIAAASVALYYFW